MDEMKKCPYCGEEIRKEAVKCRYCLSDLSQHTYSQTPPPPPNYGAYGFSQSYNQTNPRISPWEANDAFADGPEGKSRGVAALLALFLGWLGVHSFYLGKPTGGIVFVILSLLSCTSIPAILGLIQAIMMFCMTNQDFRNRYVITPSSFPF